MEKKVTHIEENPEWNSSSCERIELNNDDLGYVEKYDFSRANTSNEARIFFISKIASVCYANPKALGSISLFNRLATENKGLPSSSYEFVPILLTQEKYDAVLEILYNEYENSGDFTKPESVTKYGEWLDIEGEAYLLTNLRALMADIGELAQGEQYYNSTEKEIKIIKDNFKVYKSHIDLSTRAQFIRHRANWQELSRRYVSGAKNPFNFYISEKMKNIETSIGDDGTGTEQFMKTEDIINLCVDHYNNAILDGVKPEEARRIIPQAMYTTVWTAMQPKQLEVFYKLRLDSHAQSEIQELARGMSSLDALTQGVI